MSNVAKVQELYAAFGQGKIQVILDNCTPDVIWDVQGPAGLPFFGKRKGPAQVAQFFQDIALHLEIQEFSPKEFIAQGDYVVAIGTSRGKARASGKQVQDAWAHVFIFQNGKIKHFREFADTAAMADALRGAKQAAA